MLHQVALSTGRQGTLHIGDIVMDGKDEDGKPQLPCTDLFDQINAAWSREADVYDRNITWSFLNAGYGISRVACLATDHHVWLLFHFSSYPLADDRMIVDHEDP